MKIIITNNCKVVAIFQNTIITLHQHDHHHQYRSRNVFVKILIVTKRDSYGLFPYPPPNRAVNKISSSTSLLSMLPLPASQSLVSLVGAVKQVPLLISLSNLQTLSVCYSVSLNSSLPQCINTDTDTADKAHTGITLHTTTLAKSLYVPHTGTLFRALCTTQGKVDCGATHWRGQDYLQLCTIMSTNES